ncbi:TIGR03620 family F420-dependent LLM class oxidoreductase [Mycobacterium sp. AZCC_0083]|uniref:TIGR03620 family F420-dependent LLM class oxidoreductase n=1 Tax=Mycobacterium sp. AZCC_0083 TaxID=2735882 RepID=UPI001611BF68|nr:TIGR03620 family F420-dependent LLM class oxidoreductase [Mycobacterium sp. AZCC_0083]MBB5164628.1 putative F420-dependent oxidoreductase [Mycobacterium sp. AZCC_0083]
MTADAVVAARERLGPVGPYLPLGFTSAPPIDLQRTAVGRLERAGFRTAWTNEVIGGKDALVQLAVLLAATERMAFGTGIANIWARQPQTMHAAAAMLAQAYPGRLVLGLGVGFPEQAASAGQEFGRPLATMRDYLRRMDEQTWPPAADVAYPRIVGAMGPKLLALGGEHADGAMPAGLPPAFTALARQALGPDKLLVVGLMVIPDNDADRAKDVARQTVSANLGRGSYVATVAGLGYPDRELADVSDRIVDDVVGHGGPEAIAAKVREHLTAGADHVALMLPTGTELATGVDQLELLAPALAEAQWVTR